METSTHDKYGVMKPAVLAHLLTVPGIVWKKRDNYQKAYKLVPFEAPAEWLDKEVVLGENWEQ